ncbi:MAG: DNA adenine methylase [bacterium]
MSFEFGFDSPESENLKLGIPYLGSKRCIAKQLVDFILKENPNCKYVYDLFGGGGAMSFEFLQRPQIQKVVYNDLNTGVVNLLKHINEKGITQEFYNWIDRETFHKLKVGDDWKSGLVKTCWSFGNNQRDYLFSPENEKLKKPLHFAIVEKDPKYFEEFTRTTGLEIPSVLLDHDTINERRLKVMGFVKKNRGRIDFQRLEWLQRLQQLEQLQRLQQLQQIQQLQQLQQLELFNLSYKDIKIETPPNETIVYCDPPYKGTRGYQEKLCHDEFNLWVKSSPYKIYISEYDSPFNKVLEIEKREALSKNRNKTLEVLYCN